MSSTVPSCTQPRCFQPFNKQKINAAYSVRSSAQPSTPVFSLATRDDFMDTGSLLSVRSTGIFVMGFLAGLAGASAVGDALRKRAGSAAVHGAGKQAVKESVEKKAAESGFDQGRSNVYAYYQDPIYALVRLATLYDKLHKPLLAYLASSVVGYLSGSLIQGTQETWVRRQETLIRARLVSSLKDAFKQSIQIKYNQDAELRTKAKSRLGKILAENGISLDALLVAAKPVKESVQTNQEYFYQPTHRTVQMGNAMNPFVPGARPPQTGGAIKFGNAANPFIANSSLGGPNAMLEAGVFSTGLLMGGALHTFLKMVSNSPKAKTKALEYVNIYNQEAAFLQNNKLLLLGVFTITGLARIGKLLVDGLREIEVTGVNAATEYRYQNHNWLTLDPGFHRIAEEAALENDLKLFEEQLPAILQNSQGFVPEEHQRKALKEVKERVMTILANIGRNSAPKYFMMTPPVMLTEAKS